MDRYVLLIDSKEPVYVRSLKPGDPLTCSATFVSMDLDERGNPFEIHIDTHCGDSYG